MDEAVSPVTLVRLLSWLSPAFPIGAFAYSHGLESAMNDGAIRDRSSLVSWLTDLIERGSAWNDAALLAEAWRRSVAGLNVTDVAELANAMAGSRERHMETTLQGEAFQHAVGAWAEQKSPSTSPPSVLSYPVAVGVAAARHEIPLEQALTAYLHAFASNLIQAAVRLVPLGQREGVAALAAIEPVILATANRAAASTLEDHLGSCSIFSDIMSMKHESLHSRIFRS
ncbi:MAG: urease accessory protein UreF [Rhizobiaceae bacterium]